MHVMRARAKTQDGRTANFDMFHSGLAQGLRPVSALQHSVIAWKRTLASIWQPVESRRVSGPAAAAGFWTGRKPASKQAVDNHNSIVTLL